MSYITVEGLEVTYGSVKALEKASLEVEQAEAFALVGPNGAGKTSLVKSLLGLVHYEGRAMIDGIDARNSKARESLAYLPEKFSFYSYYTVQAVLEFYARMRGVASNEVKKHIQECAEKVHIQDLLGRKIKQMSKGQVQRLGLATTLVGNSSIIILDEPFSGLDPIGIKDMKDLIAQMIAEGKTIFLNTHILSEVEKICHHFAIVNKGIIIDQKKVSDLAGENLEDYFYNKVGRS